MIFVKYKWLKIKNSFKFQIYKVNKVMTDYEKIKSRLVTFRRRNNISTTRLIRYT
jgi:hypothetical protein